MDVCGILRAKVEETDSKGDLNKLLDEIETAYKNKQINVKQYAELTRIVCDKFYYEVEV